MSNFQAPNILVVAAHAGDFVWRCGGTIAKYAKRGSNIKILVMSDGLRGESNDYWKTEGANEKDGHILRQNEARSAAEILGVKDIEFWGLVDYPMTINDECVEKIAHVIRAFRPDIILTHAEYDQFNPDHNAVHLAVRKAVAAASGAGFPDENPVSPRQTPIFGYEPQQTEISGYTPVVYNNITDAFDTKCEAMKVYATQPGMFKNYVRKAEVRGGEAKSRGSCKGCKYAEAFEVYQPIAATGDLVW